MHHPTADRFYVMELCQDEDDDAVSAITFDSSNHDDSKYNDDSLSGVDVEDVEESYVDRALGLSRWSQLVQEKAPPSHPRSRGPILAFPATVPTPGNTPVATNQSPRQPCRQASMEENDTANNVEYIHPTRLSISLCTVDAQCPRKPERRGSFDEEAPAACLSSPAKPSKMPLRRIMPLRSKPKRSLSLCTSQEAPPVRWSRPSSSVCWTSGAQDHQTPWMASLPQVFPMNTSKWCRTMRRPKRNDSLDTFGTV